MIDFKYVYANSYNKNFHFLFKIKKAEKILGKDGKTFTMHNGRN